MNYTFGLNQAYQQWYELLNQMHELNADAVYGDMNRRRLRKAQGLTKEMNWLYSYIWRTDEQFARSVDMGTDEFLRTQAIGEYMMEHSSEFIRNWLIE